MPIKKSDRIAIARIFADLIKADRIVDTGEMEYWDKVCQKYQIERDDRIGARSISFAEAIDTICRADLPGLKEDLLGDCRAMTTSDGFCAHSEALLMMALITMLDANPPFRGEVFSIPRANFNIDIATVLYIEQYFDPDTNEAIQGGYRSIFKELQLAGFHFVYLPNIIRHYQTTDPRLFKDILSFLAPAMSAEGIDKAYNALIDMKTGTFVTDLLCNRCGITQLRHTAPSLLIKIGNSFVDEDPYANYLKIDVDDDILSTVQEFVDRFTEMLSSDVYVVNTSEERDNQFHFHGFYKQLLEIFLIKRNIRSTILIDPYNNTISLPDLEERLSDLHRRERALYTLLLCQGPEGINFAQPRTGEDMARYKERMKRVQKRFEAIYDSFRGPRDGVPDLSVAEIRHPIVSCLRRVLRGINGLYNPGDYTVSGSRGKLSVHIEPEMVLVRDDVDAQPVPLLQSKLYRRFRSQS